MSIPSRVSFAVLYVALSAGTASTQNEPSVATMTYAEGVVYLDDRLVVTPSPVVVLGESSSIRTSDGRAVVALKQGARLALNAHTLVRVRANGAYNFNRIEVLEGTAVVISQNSAPIVSCRSDARLSSAGVFRFDVQPISTDGTAPCRLRVHEGAAAVPLTTVTSALRSGQQITLDPACGDMIPTVTFAPHEDDFDRWSRQQVTARR